MTKICQTHDVNVQGDTQKRAIKSSCWIKKIGHYTLAQPRQMLTDFSVHFFGYVEQSVGCVCVCVCVCECLCIWAETVNLSGLWPRYLAS